METYSMLRHLADSWVLLAMFVMFLGAILFLFRPGAQARQHEAANTIFNHDDRPLPPEVKQP